MSENTPTRSNRKSKTKKHSRAFGNDQKNRMLNASKEFRRAFPAEKDVRKTSVFARLVKAGLKKSTVASYMTWAKRDVAGTPDHANPWGFQLVESRNAKGEKVIRKVELAGAA